MTTVMITITSTMMSMMTDDIDDVDNDDNVCDSSKNDHYCKAQT
jgi:hypothetical protein